MTVQTPAFAAETDAPESCPLPPLQCYAWQGSTTQLQIERRRGTGTDLPFGGLTLEDHVAAPSAPM